MGTSTNPHFLSIAKLRKEDKSKLTISNVPFLRSSLAMARLEAWSAGQSQVGRISNREQTNAAIFEQNNFEIY